MRFFIVCTAAVSLLIQNAPSAEAAENHPDWNRGSASGDGSWSWTLEVPQTVVDAAPRWQPADGECPLTPQAAYKKAVEAFRQFDLGDPALYRLTFSVETTGPSAIPFYDIALQSSKGPTLDFLVFLNGSVVSPKFHAKTSSAPVGESQSQQVPRQPVGLPNEEGLAPVCVGQKYDITLETTHTSGLSAVYSGAAVEILEHGRGSWYRVRHLGDGRQLEPAWVNFDFVSTIQPDK